jgi:hypothetical protein
LLTAIYTDRFLVLAQSIGDLRSQNHEKLSALALGKNAGFCEGLL